MTAAAGTASQTGQWTVYVLFAAPGEDWDNRIESFKSETIARLRADHFVERMKDRGSHVKMVAIQRSRGDGPDTGLESNWEIIATAYDVSEKEKES